jgi:hypothetical protein
MCHASSREIQPQNPDIETLTLLCELQKPRTKQQRPFFPVFLHGLLQPAAALVQAARCPTTNCKARDDSDQ